MNCIVRCDGFYFNHFFLNLQILIFFFLILHFAWLLYLCYDMSQPTIIFFWADAFFFFLNDNIGLSNLRQFRVILVYIYIILFSFVMNTCI